MTRVSRPNDWLVGESSPVIGQLDTQASRTNAWLVGESSPVIGQLDICDVKLYIPWDFL